MPALGNSSRERFVAPQRAAPTPPPPRGYGVLAPPPAPHASMPSGPLSSHPFHQAIVQAQQHVERAQLAQPKAPTPNIPRIPNPTAAQARAALHVALASQRQAVGPRASAQRVAAYQQELRNDPRQHDYLATLEHFSRALAAHEGVGPAVGAARAQAALRTPETGRDGGGLLGTLGSLLSGAGNLAADAIHTTYGQGTHERVPGKTSLSPGLAMIQPINSQQLLKEGVTGTGTNEVFDLPAQSVLSLATLLGAAKSAIPRGAPGSPLSALGGEGDTKPLQQLGGAMVHQVEHPVQSFKQAPLATLLTLAGVEGGVGGAIGKVGRAAGVDAFSTVRPDLKLYGEPVPAGPVEGPVPAPQVRTDARAPVRAPQRLEPAAPPAEGLRKLQRYNPDPARKAAQILYEKSLTKLPGGLRQTDPFQAQGWRLRRAVVGGQLHPGRVDYTTTGGEQARRTIVKSIVGKAVGLKPKVGAEAVPLMVDNTIRLGSATTPETIAADLAKRAEALKAVQPELKGTKLGENKASLDQIEGLRTDKAFLKDPSEAIAAARTVKAVQKPLTAMRVLHGGLLPDQLRAALFPYAQSHMGAVHDGSALRAADGSVLSNHAIQSHMRASGVEDPGFISHKPGVGGGKSYFQSVRRFPSLERFNRTGEAYRKGTIDHSFSGLAGHLASEASKVAQHEVRLNDLNQYVLGHYDTPAAAQAAADNLVTTSEGHRVAALGPMKVISMGSNQILERGHVAPQDIQGSLHQFGLAEHTPVDTAKYGKYGLIPEDVFNRMAAHDNAASARGDWKRYLQAYTQAFRHVKFATSPHHFAGIIQEQGIRLVTEQAGALAKLSGKRFQKGIAHLAEVDKHGVLADEFGPLGMKYRQLEGVLAGRGGLVSGSKENDIVRKAGAWQESSSTVKDLGEAAGRSVPMKGWLGFRKATEAGLVKVEHQTRQTLVGKALRDTGFIPSYREALKMTDAGMRAHIEGKLTPNMADAIARNVDDMGGNWNHQTPAVRAAVGTLTPFGLWWLNSLRWLYRLPVTHPIKTAIASSLYAATRGSRNAEGQGFDAPGAATRANPGYLQGSVAMTLPVFGRVRTDFGHYSPVGTLGPEAGSTAVSMIAPQLSGVLDALSGTSSLTHEKLTDAQGRELSSEPGPSVLNALTELASGPTVGATQLQQVLQHGGKPYGTANLVTDVLSKLGGPAQVKPGTEKPFSEVLGKLINPVRAYKVGPSSSSAAKDPFTQSRREAAKAAHGGVDSFLQSRRNEAREEHERALATR